MQRERLRLRHWMFFWILVLANVALVCAIFGNVDVNTLKPVSVVDEGQNTAEQLVTDLKTELSELQKKVQDAESRAAQTTECETLEVAPIDTYVTYVDPKTQVSMSVPYSFGWNGKDCEISPVTIDSSNIGFGPLMIPFGRYASLEILPREEAEKILSKDLPPPTTAEMPTDLLEVATEIQRRSVNGLAVTIYNIAPGGVTERRWVAAGRTYTYVIRDTRQWLTDIEAVKIIQSLRVTN